MTRTDKLLLKLAGKPKDFTWHELERLLGKLGYESAKQGKTGGSRRRFTHEGYPTIVLHKPHPGNILKHYQIDQLIDIFTQEGWL